jgi:hypothetical protein
MGAVQGEQGRIALCGERARQEIKKQPYTAAFLVSFSFTFFFIFKGERKAIKDPNSFSSQPPYVEYSTQKP